ncbi:MAG: PAS domain S-box protein [Candidatus Omnitrophica bacterium]|nr:PAS domain S-box protein [Candidatus Omnitrophota bacterium]
MRISLRVKWVIYIAILIVLSASALSFYFIGKLKTSEKAHLVRQGLNLTSNLAYNSEYGVLIANEEMLSKLIQGVTREKDVVYCVIQDLQGRILSSDGVNQGHFVFTEDFNKKALDVKTSLVQFYYSPKGVGIYDIAVPIISETKESYADELEFFAADQQFPLKTESSKIGVARVGISIASANKRIYMVQRTALIATSIVIVIAVFITYFMVGAIVTPIQRLVKGTKTLAMGNLDYRTSIQTNDEIGDLGKAFNKMTKDLKASRDELVKAKDYANNIIESMLDSVIIVSPEGRIVRVNPATVDLLGYREIELIGKGLAIIFLDGKMPFEGKRLKALIKEGKLGNYETYYQAKNGKKIPVLFSGSVMKDIYGSVICIVCTARDITDRKKTEETLQKAYTELKETQDQLIQAEKMEVVGSLASGVAHEVKNPLSIILQCVDYLLEKVKTDDKNIAMTLGHIKDSVKRADNVAKGLLDFSSLSKLNVEEYNLNAIAERALFLMKHQFDRHHIAIERQLDNDLPLVKVDRNRIEQAFINIFMNAASAMHAGGKLTIASYVSKSDNEDKTVIFHIEDTGPGIPEETLGKIFDPFFTTRREFGGTGLGLSVVMNIIERHNAKISVYNRQEGGVRVSLIFKA